MTKKVSPKDQREMVKRVLGEGFYTVSRSGDDTRG